MVGIVEGAVQPVVGLVARIGALLEPFFHARVALPRDGDALDLLLGQVGDVDIQERLVG